MITEILMMNNYIEKRNSARTTEIGSGPNLDKQYICMCHDRITTAF